MILDEELNYNHYSDYMLDVINQISENNTVAVFGLGLVPSDFHKKLKFQKNVTFIEDYIQNISIKNYTYKKWDYIFLSRVAEHFTDHYNIWNHITKLTKNVVITVPDMDFTFKQYQKSLQSDVQNGSISFKTLRILYEIYSELTSNKNEDCALHRIFYCEDIFKKQPINFFPNGIYFDKYKVLSISGFKHIEAHLIIDGSDQNEIDEELQTICKNFLVNSTVIKTEHSNRFLINDLFTALSEELLNVALVVTENESKIYNLFSTVKPRLLDYYLYLISSIIPQNYEIYFQEYDKFQAYTKILEALDKENIYDFWKYNNIIFETPYHTDENLIKLFLTQENLFGDIKISRTKSTCDGIDILLIKTRRK